MNDLAEIYNKSPIVVWVEDVLTREYLSSLWDDGQIGYMISGGCENIASVVKAARAESFKHVFGIRDRDFRETNFERWGDSNCIIEVFTLPCYEIENYLLDAKALETCSENVLARTEREIDAFMLADAKKQTACMACRALIAWIESVVRDDFPKHPTIEKVDDPKKIAPYVIETPWFKNLGAKIAGLSQTEIQNNAARWYEAMSNHLADGNWIREFKGKPIFNTVANYLHAGRSTIGDVARSIGAWQRDNAPPPELVVLRSELLKRVSFKHRNGN